MNLMWSFESKTLSPFLNSPATELLGQFSPDGRHVTYFSDESGPFETWIARFPSLADKRHIATNAGPVSWRADGREILVTNAVRDLAGIPVTATGDRLVTGEPVVLVRRLDDVTVNPTRDHLRFLEPSRPDPEQGVAEIRLLTGWREKLR